MDDTNPGNKPLEGAPSDQQKFSGSKQPQPPQYQRAPQQQPNYPTQQLGLGSQGPQGPQGPQGSHQQPGSPQQQWGPGPQGPRQQPGSPQQQWGPGPQDPQGYQGQFQQQRQYPQQGQFQQQNSQKSKGGVIAAVVAVAALLIIGVLVFGITQAGWFSSNSSNSAASSTEAQDSSAAGGSTGDSDLTSESDGGDTSTSEESSARPKFPDMPSNAVPANDAAAAGKPAGDFNNVYIGSSVTSKEFAREVRDTFVDEWVSHEKTNTTIDVYSPVTHQNYSMKCVDNNSYITCTGGNNAIVYIA
ncbi:hypothetical protein GSS87_06575 [Corynebacterium sp. 4HC-13]|uniref:hypothetical protein n=1 Tax=Corynebacterium anserum TaxID=2684406 RepID=UPI00163AD532|nr:hypothetical protein [Corynebacterium anserum]MBC2682058.1 hypothetical protein [Corynebacterium anserum]